MKKNWLILAIICIVTALSLSTSAFFYWKVKSSVPPVTAKSATPSLQDRVGRHIVLPNEKATVIPVVNAETLKKSQAFFTNAKDGDVVLVFTKKVILYDPKADKVVEVAVIK